MTALIDALGARLRPSGGSKALNGAQTGFVEPTFWSLVDQLRYPLLGSTSLNGDELIDNHFEGYVTQAYKDNGVVFACLVARQLLFSETRFQYRRTVGGRHSDLYGTPDLALLEQPWPGGTTGELLGRMESDSSLAGNFFATTADDQGRIGRASIGGRGRRVVRMRPDWVTIVSASRTGSPRALDAKIVGYIYRPSQGTSPADEEVLLLPSEVCHYSPIPDPAAQWRGMSWLTPVLREVEADKAATVHKGRFFRNGATPAMAVSLDKDVSYDDFVRFKTAFELNHRGADNAYKTLFLGGGADVKPMTMDLRQLDFKLTQGAGETRVAAAARVPPVIVGLSEGLAAQTYSNYGQAKRHFADGTMRPLWRMAAASLQVLVDREDGSELWYDDREISFLREDQRDAAEIQGREADTIRTLIEAGFTPASAIAAVTTSDFTQLVHTGRVSVQLQEPGANDQRPGATSEENR